MTKAKTTPAPLKVSRTRKGKPAADAAPVAPAPAVNPAMTVLTGKLGVIVGLLRRPQGALISELTAATGWQAHSVRGAIAGALKKKRGIVVTSQAHEAGRVYRVEAGA